MNWQSGKFQWKELKQLKLCYLQLKESHTSSDPHPSIISIYKREWSPHLFRINRSALHVKIEAAGDPPIAS